MPAKFDRMVQALRKRPGVRNPYAVATAKLGPKKRGKKKK